MQRIGDKKSSPNYGGFVQWNAAVLTTSDPVNPDRWTSNPDYRRAMGVSGPPPIPPQQPTAPSTQPARPPGDQPMPKWAKRLIWNVCLIGGLVIFMGFTHCIPSGPNICWKESWGLKDTFIDPDDFVGKSRLYLLDRMSTVRALEGCGVLRFGPEKKTHEID